MEMNIQHRNNLTADKREENNVTLFYQKNKRSLLAVRKEVILCFEVYVNEHNIAMRAYCPYLRISGDTSLWGLTHTSTPCGMKWLSVLALQVMSPQWSLLLVLIWLYLCLPHRKERFFYIFLLLLPSGYSAGQHGLILS